jgi:Fe-S cluster assembly iron-binding protein IscA
MMHVTPAAHHHLMQLLSEHPEERLVRIEMKDIDDHRIAFNIALESDEKPDDAVQVCDGLTIAVAANSVARMQGVVVDYSSTSGFTFIHPAASQDNSLGLIHLN